MNLDKYNTIELKSDDLKSINGGIIPAILAIAGAAFYFGWEIGREYGRNN
jgi:lactobin A/cerein 7B family class IIb bacteriocin